MIVDNDKLTEVKTLLDSVASQLKGLCLLYVYSFIVNTVCSCTTIYRYVHYLTESSIRIPGVPEEVSKQFREMLLKEKDVALGGDAKPATGSNDATSDNGRTLMISFM